MNSVSMSPSAKAAADQGADRKAIEAATTKAVNKMGVVGAQVAVANGNAKAGLGTQAIKDAVIDSHTRVGASAEKTMRCSMAEAMLSTIKAMEPANSKEDPLVAGAYANLGVAETGIAAYAGARASVGEEAKKIPVNLDCTPPKPPKEEPPKAN